MNPTAPECRLCGWPISRAALSLGTLPVCNDFGRTPGIRRTAALDVVECERCQLIQLREAAPVDVLMPRVPWIRYREPEAHLDVLIGELRARRPEARTALGAGPFEQPLLSRLAAHGLATQTLPLAARSADERHPCLESWPASLTDQALVAAAQHSAPYDIVSCRYLIEHCAAPVEALRALGRVVSATGLVVIEVPDSSKFLAARDYAFLWEEHVSYFTEATLRRLAESAGYRVLALCRYPGALEDALVAVLQPGDHPLDPQNRELRPWSSALFRSYQAGFQPARDRVRARLAGIAGRGPDAVALFGIGHHAIMFANAFGVTDRIALAVDDDADKSGFFPPGFRVPVVGSERLLDDHRIKLCLFAIAPHLNGQVRGRLTTLAERGVEFRSIYAAADDSIVGVAVTDLAS
jgi:Methyltransferase domain/Putative zinc binding domain/C-methyltransferase C-terminal domain